MKPETDPREYDYYADWNAPQREKDRLERIEDMRRQVNGDDVADGVRLVRADGITPERVEYFEAGLIPLRTVTITTGIDGVGKSTMLYWKSARATRGQLPGDFHGTPVDVVIASSEDHPASVIVPRLIAAGADLARVHIIRVARDGITGDISLPDDADAIAREVQAVDARLLIVDPLVAHLPLNIDSHKAQHVRQALAPLARLAEEAHLAVAAVVHFNGSPATDVRSRISGSKALRDCSRSVIVCGVDPDDETRFVMVQDKNSFGPRATTGQAYRIEGTEITHHDETFKTSSIVWLGEVTITANALLQHASDTEERGAVDEAVGILRELLADTPIPAVEGKRQATALGVSEGTLRRARVRLGVRAQRVLDDAGKVLRWDWSLPPEPGAQGTPDVQRLEAERLDDDSERSRRSQPQTPGVQPLATEIVEHLAPGPLLAPRPGSRDHVLQGHWKAGLGRVPRAVG